MKSSRRPGRPNKHTDAIDKATILACAIAVIEKSGLEALSFRTLASRLGVTPMAVSYHVGSRDQMIADLIAQSFGGVASDVPDGTACEKLRFLLLRYCQVALAHSSLVRCMLNDPKLMPDALLQLTELVRQQTRSLNDGDEGDVLLNLLIDYVHGFVFSATAAPPHIKLVTEDCARSLDWLLRLIKANQEDFATVLST